MEHSSPAKDTSADTPVVIADKENWSPKPSETSREVTDTSCGCIRPDFFDEIDHDAADDEDSAQNFKLLYLQSELLQTEYRMNEFWAVEANRCLQIDLLYAKVDLREQQRKQQKFKLERKSTDAKVFSTQETQTNFDDDGYAMVDEKNVQGAVDVEETERGHKDTDDKEDQPNNSSPAKSIDSEANTMTDSQLQDINEKSSDAVSDDIPCRANENSAAADSEEVDEMESGKDGIVDEVEEAKDITDQSENSAKAMADGNIKLTEDAKAIEEDTGCIGRQESTPTIALDSPDLLSRIANKFKETQSSKKATSPLKCLTRGQLRTLFNELPENPLSLSTPECAVVTDTTTTRVSSRSQKRKELATNLSSGAEANEENDDQNNSPYEAETKLLDMSISSDSSSPNDDTSSTSRRAAAARRRDRQEKKEKRKKRVTGDDTSALYSTFKPPVLKNNKRQRRRRW